MYNNNHKTSKTNKSHKTLCKIQTYTRHYLGKYAYTVYATIYFNYIATYYGCI